MSEHAHQWGAVEVARFTGTPHRKCTTDGCRYVSLDLSDEDQEDPDGPDFVRIEIPESHERADAPDLLRHIADQIEESYREGYHPRWALTPEGD